MGCSCSTETIKRHLEHVAEKCPTCCICLDVITSSKIAPQQTLLTLPCMHVFHTPCIDPWKAKSDTCPICRHPFRETKTHKTQPLIRTENWFAEAMQSIRRGYEATPQTRPTLRYETLRGIPPLSSWSWNIFPLEETDDELDQNETRHEIERVTEQCAQ